MSKYHNIVREFNSRAWAITPEKLAEITHVLTTRLSGGMIPADVVAAYKEAAAQRRAATPNGGGAVAVIPIYGTITQRSDLMSSGGTSTQELGAQFDAAMANASVGSIVFDIDSPGGSVSGVPELAAKISAARGTKPIIAVANSLCASAAYWIASAADEIVASPSADVGSIGVYAAHVDASAQLEEEGLKYTLISAGKYKVEGNPFEPLSDEARAAMQASVDEFYAMFTSDVAKNRDVSVKDVRNGYGEGRVLTAKSALAAGMVDRIATLDDVLGDLTRGAMSTTRRAASGARPMRQAGPLAEATEPAHAVGDRVRALVDHMPGMKGMVGAVAEANAGAPPYYAVQFDGESDVHKWLAEDEVEPATGSSMGATSVTRRAASVDLIDRVAATLIAEPIAQWVPTITTAGTGYDNNITIVFPSPTASPFNAPVVVPPIASADEAVVAAPLPTLETAPQARSHTVPNENTAANGAASEPSRELQIMQLAELAGKDLAWTTQAITSGKAVAAIQLDLTSERRQAAVPAATGTVRVGLERETTRPFASLGEQLMAVVAAGKSAVTGSGAIDPRLNRYAGPSGMNESVGSEGGFLVHPEFLPEITQSVFENDPILSRVRQVPISAGKQSVTYNVVDETSRATGSRSGGVQVYWAAEAGTASASKPKLREQKLEKKKLLGFAYLTDELAEDGPAAQALITNAFTKEFGFVVGDAVFRGSGVGQPLGFMNSGAVVSQAIESTQTIANTDTFIAKNVTKMLARVPASLWSEAIWLYNQEMLPKLVNATNGSSGAIPLFMGMGGLANKPYDTILGRPAFASELCEAEGTVGDFMLVVPSQYDMIGSEKPEYAESIHVRFLYGENTLRFTTRTDGQPVWRTAVTRYKGASTLSPFVTLAARS